MKRDSQANNTSNLKVMKIVSQLQFASNRDEDKLTWNTDVSEDHNIESAIVQNDYTIPYPHIENDFILRQLYTDGLILIDYRFDSKNEAVWSLSADQECILMEFILSEKIIDPEAKTNKSKNVASCHNLRYLPSLATVYPLDKGSTLDVFYVILSKSFYFKLIGKTSKVNESFAASVQHGMEMSLTDTLFSMNYQMEKVINDVRNCTRKGSFHRLCLEIKLLELLLLQFEQAHKRNQDSSEKQILHENDVQSIKAAQAILLNNYNMPPTIRQLSQLVGINESKLKSGFKIVFQSTIHEYVTKLRMERANELVKTHNLQMREVAIELGYKNPSHFSAAFKRHFGFLPTEMVL